jgi:hypothetical protein
MIFVMAFVENGITKDQRVSSNETDVRNFMVEHIPTAFNSIAVSAAMIAEVKKDGKSHRHFESGNHHLEVVLGEMV